MKKQKTKLKPPTGAKTKDFPPCLLHSVWQVSTEFTICRLLWNWLRWTPGGDFIICYLKI